MTTCCSAATPLKLVKHQTDLVEDLLGGLLLVHPVPSPCVCGEADSATGARESFRMSDESDYLRRSSSTAADSWSTAGIAIA